MNTLESDVAAKINEKYPLRFSDISIEAEGITFKVHKFVLNQREGLLQLLTLRPNNSIKLTTYPAVGIAGTLLIIYGLTDSVLFRKIKLLTGDTVEKTFSSLYPGISIDKEIKLKLNRAIASDLTIYDGVDQRPLFVNKAILWNRCTKLKGLIPETNKLHIKFLNAIQVRILFEFLYFGEIKKIFIQDFIALTEYAYPYVDDMELFITEIVKKISYYKATSEEYIDLICALRNQIYIESDEIIKTLVMVLIQKQPFLSPDYQLKLGHIDLRFLLKKPEEMHHFIQFIRHNPLINSVDLRSTSVSDKDISVLYFEIRFKNFIIDFSCQNLSGPYKLLFSNNNNQEKLRALCEFSLILTDHLIEKFYSMIKGIPDYEEKMVAQMSLDQRHITDEGLIFLGRWLGDKCEQLMLLENKNITTKGFLTIIEFFPNLKKLELSINQEKGEFNLADILLYNHLSKLTKLQSLSLGSTPPHQLELLAKTLQTIPSLKHLYLKSLPEFNEGELFPFISLPLKIHFSIQANLSERARKLFKGSFSFGNEIIRAITHLEMKLLIRDFDLESIYILMLNSYYIYEWIDGVIVIEFLIEARKQNKFFELPEGIIIL